MSHTPAIAIEHQEAQGYRVRDPRDHSAHCLLLLLLFLFFTPARKAFYIPCASPFCQNPYSAPLSKCKTTKPKTSLSLSLFCLCVWVYKEQQHLLYFSLILQPLKTHLSRSCLSLFLLTVSIKSVHCLASINSLTSSSLVYTLSVCRFWTLSFLSQIVPSTFLFASLLIHRWWWCWRWRTGRRRLRRGFGRASFLSSYFHFCCWPICPSSAHFAASTARAVASLKIARPLHVLPHSTNVWYCF